MAKELILMAEPRTVLGKKNKALRRAGLVPGVVYGPAVEGTSQVSVNRRELERFYQAHGHSTLFTLTWNGGSQQVFIQEVQVEPVRRAPLHVDFFAPNLKKELVGKVALALHGHNPHAEGVITQLLDEVEIRALPSDMPHQIDVDISGLVHAHDTVKAGDLTLHGNVTLVTDPDVVLVSMVASSGAIADAEAAAEAATADAEAHELPSADQADAPAAEDSES